MGSRDQLFLASTILGVGFVTFCICLPLIYRKVPMNRIYGIRIRQSFVSDERWYEINATGGRLLARWSCLIMFTGALGFMVPTRFLSEYASVAAVVVLSVFAPLVQMIRWAKATQRTEPE